MDQNIQEIPKDSTVIDTDADAVKSGGGVVPNEQVDKPEQPRKTESVRDSLEAEAKKISAAKPEDDDEDNPDDGDKVEKAEKPKEDTKTKEPVKEVNKSAPTQADAAEQEAKTQKPSEGRRVEPPAQFLPHAKNLWKNVPNVVQEEWARLDRERETEISQYREAKQFRDELKDFEELAQRHNVPFKQALNNYVDIERKFSEDPATGFRQLCQNLNITAPQAIGHILRSANVTPQQLIEHMQREPHVYTSLAQQAPQQQQQSTQRAPDPEVLALKQEVESMRAERVANDVIRPFAAEYPEYYQNEGAIAEVLKSGIIERIHGNGLSSRDKLEAALFMVAPQTRGRSAQSDDSYKPVQDSHNENAPAVDLQGGKSVRSSPGEVTDVVEPYRKVDMRKMLEEEADKISRRRA